MSSATTSGNRPRRAGQPEDGRDDSGSAGAALRSSTARIADSTWGERVARTGLAARGVVFLLLGYLVARVADGALGPSNQSPASLPGVAQALDRERGGTVALGVLAAGLLLYALFSLLDTVLHHNDESPAAKRWGDRALSAWGVVMYLAFAAYCIDVAVTTGSRRQTGSSDQHRTTQLSAEVLRWPGGVVWLGLLGTVITVMGVFLVARAARRTFRPRLQRQRMTRRAWITANVLGTLGYLGRAALFLIVGGCILAAAVEDDPRYGQGVNGAVRVLAADAAGRILLLAVAAMLVVYGLYLFVETRYRRV